MIIGRFLRAICSPMRWLTRELSLFKLEKQLDKTFIGRIETGFDVPGYHLAPGRLTLAATTGVAFHEPCSRHYGQKVRQIGAREAHIKRWIARAKRQAEPRL
ncbi:hypothetical protein [Sphingorhabdus sp. SMR4y]|uniref:hypothetical protein n=1 Tax=Sphingorhabdus sp. SMR4y TaxID=2584094 RepID=UPI0011AB51F0|nr:hypothetical protein [Sphingorhabdus sp. SMR4y]